MEMAREEAILAQERQTKENQILVLKMKEESAIRGDEIEKNIQEDLSKRKEVIGQVHSQKDKTRVMVQAKKEENKNIRDEVHKDLSEALQRKREEEAI